MPKNVNILLMTLKELRKRNNISQKEAAALIGIPIRTYSRYENEEKYEKTLKYQKMYEILSDHFKIDENNGILSFEFIKEMVNDVFQKYEISYAYLFGSYAKNNPNEKSDIDILVCTDISGLKYYGIVEELRDLLNKKVDMIRIQDLKNNDLLNEVLKSGVKIYG